MIVNVSVCYALVALLCVAYECQQGAYAELLTSADTADAINNLYENLLQREYAGPVVFPSHQMERKAQRSPSLRLRFGRRSDPDEALLPAAEKRWWGDVNQKPIRSPSLRLRFGKRQSAETAAIRNSFDTLLNNLAADETLQDYNDEGYEGGYERVVRKPQRLRWGRSVPYQQQAVVEAGNYGSFENLPQSLKNSQKWHNVLLGLTSGTASEASDELNFDEFERNVRKPGGPLRLRWGRSTGGIDVTAANKQQLQQKKSLATSVAAIDTKQQTVDAHVEPNAN